VVGEWAFVHLFAQLTLECASFLCLAILVHVLVRQCPWGWGCSSWMGVHWMSYIVVPFAVEVPLDFAERRMCWRVIGIAEMEI
jgi:hypothetical protein